MEGILDNGTGVVYGDNVTNETGSGLSSGTNDNLEPPMYIVVLSTMFYILIFIIGIVGNILVIVVVALSKSMKTSVNLYLINLCVADLLVVVICMPTALADIYTKEAWHFGEAMCKLVPFLENTVAGASVLTILAISVERYRVVSNPLKGMKEHTVLLWKVVAGIWVVSVAASAPFVSIPRLRSSKYLDGTPVTVCRTPIDLLWQKTYVVLLFVLHFLIPCVLLFVLYCRLFYNVRKAKECNKVISQLSARQERKRRHNQVVNTVFSIVAIFFICHLPFRVATLWFSFENKNVIYSLGLERFLNLLYSTRIMFYLNHALNPVVYNFMSTKFRSALKALLYRGKRKNSTRSTIVDHYIRQPQPQRTERTDCSFKLVTGKHDQSCSKLYTDGQFCMKKDTRKHRNDFLLGYKARRYSVETEEDRC